MYEQNDVEKAIEEVCRNFKIQELKEEQNNIVLHIVNGRNLFVVLPTGFGKSLGFYLPPLVLNILDPGKRHTSLVISPLKSLIFNQVEVLTSHGIRCVALTPDVTAEDMLGGMIDVLFSSPEMALGEKGQQIFRSKTFRQNVCLLAFDESHCITEWGNEFRPKYKEISSVRSHLTHAPVLMLTATTTTKIMDGILDTLMLRHQPVEVVALVPDRPNIRLNVKNAKRFELELDWYIQMLRTQGKDAPKAIIYCKSLTDVAEIYTYMMHKVGETAWLMPEKKRAHMRIIDMYHSALLAEDQQRITHQFPKENSNIRCVIATVAFGLGVDVPDVKYVFHWGPSKSPLQYWQEVGRCSRNGAGGECFMFVSPRSLDPRRVDKTMIEICRSEKCLRVSVLEHLTVPGMDTTRLDCLRERKSCTEKCTECRCSLCTCTCCSRCCNLCQCNSYAPE